MKEVPFQPFLQHIGEDCIPDDERCVIIFGQTMFWIGFFNRSQKEWMRDGIEITEPIIGWQDGNCFF